MILGTKEEILRRIGTAVKERRLQKNVTQSLLAERSGLSLTVVKRLENGEGATLASFVLICRALNLDWWIGELEPKETVSPIAYADALKKAAKKKRRRAHV